MKYALWHTVVLAVLGLTGCQDRTTDINTNTAPLVAAAAGPIVERGIMSAPSTAPPEQIADDHLRSRAAVPPGVALSWSRTGSVVRAAQTWRGLPVVGGTAAVRLDDQGRVRWSRHRLIDIPAAVATRPVWTLEEATEHAHRSLAGDAGAISPAKAELVIYAPSHLTPRLAWQLQFPLDEDGQAMRVFVDAGSGDVLDAQDMVLYDRQAYVYDVSPAVSTKAQVTLDHLAPGATVLKDADFDVRACVDHQQCTLFESEQGGELWLNLCALEPTAVAGGAGDFLYDVPPDDTVADDRFAEVQVYHHLSKALAWFRGLGLDQLRTPAMIAVANYREDSYVCSGPTTDTALPPHYNNAFFSPGGLLGHPDTGDVLAFGNGKTADLGWDGDIVYHELGHAVMQSVGELGRVIRDQHGIDVTPWAMHEGLADYFAAALTEDPIIGDYYFPSTINTRARDLRDSAVCNDFVDFGDLVIGEPHSDGMVISSALWELRQGLPAADRPKLDAAVFEVVSAFDELDTFATAADLLSAEIDTRLGAATAAVASSLFDARNLRDCARSLPLISDPVAPLHRAILAGANPGVCAGWPSPLQFSFEITAPVDAITFTQSNACLSTVGYLKAGAPIVWDWDAVPVHTDATGVAPGEHLRGIKKVPLWKWTFHGPFTPGQYYLHLANTGPVPCILGTDVIQHFPLPESETLAYFEGEDVPDEWVCSNTIIAAHLAECYDGICEQRGSDPDCPTGRCDLPGYDPDCDPSLPPLPPPTIEPPVAPDCGTAGPTPDPEDPPADDAGGCCDARGRPEQSWLPALGVALWLLRRRRLALTAATAAPRARAG